MRFASPVISTASVIVTTFVVLALSICPLAAKAQAGEIWKAAPQAASQLDAPLAFGAWRLQKPSWARSLSQLTSGGRSSVTVVQTWGSKPRPDGTFPMLMLTLTDMKSSLVSAEPGGVMNALEASTLRGKAGLVIADRQHSLLNGLPAEREYWKYSAPGNGEVHGFFYTAVQGSRFAAVTGMDAAPNHVLTLPVLEAAALTLQSTDPETQTVPAVAAPPLPAPARPADFLGSEASALGYKIRPPQGYTPLSVSDPDMQMAMWVGAKHADGQSSTLLVARTPAPAPGAAGAASPAQDILLGMLHSVQKRYQNVQTNPARNGMINTIPAVYVYWTGTAPVSGARMHGFGYGAQDGGTVLLFIGMDSEPTQSATLPILDASVMTFHH